jgi:hypothetical protein
VTDPMVRQESEAKATGSKATEDSLAAAEQEGALDLEPVTEEAHSVEVRATLGRGLSWAEPSLTQAPAPLHAWHFIVICQRESRRRVFLALCQLALYHVAQLAGSLGVVGRRFLAKLIVVGGALRRLAVKTLKRLKIDRACESRPRGG